MGITDNLIAFFIGILQNFSYGLLAPIFPEQVQKRKLPLFFVGIVFALYGITWAITPMFTVKKCFPAYGRQQTAVCGSLLLSLGLTIFGLAGFSNSPVIFATFSIIARVCQGCGSSLEQTAFSALIGQIYRNNRQKITIFFLLGQALGNAIGPLLAGFLNQYIEYSAIFIMMGFISLIKAFLYYFYTEPNRSSVTPPTKYGKTTCHLLKHCLPLCTFLNAFLSISYLVCYQPILSTHLQLFHKSTNQSGFYFFIYSLTGTSLAFFLALIPQSCNKRPLLLAGNVVVGIGLLLSGPSKILHFPNNPTLILTGMIISRIGNSFAYAFVFAESWSVSFQLYPNPTEQLIDYVSGLVTIMFGLAMTITPILSSSLTQSIGFRSTMDILALISFVFFIFYLSAALAHSKKKEQEDDPPRVSR